MPIRCIEGHLQSSLETAFSITAPWQHVEIPRLSPSHDYKTLPLEYYCSDVVKFGGTRYTGGGRCVAHSEVLFELFNGSLVWVKEKSRLHGRDFRFDVSLEHGEYEDELKA